MHVLVCVKSSAHGCEYHHSTCTTNTPAIATVEIMMEEGMLTSLWFFFYSTASCFIFYRQVRAGDGGVVEGECGQIG